MIKDFIYNDIVLYSKGWYKRSDDIVEDLGYLFSKLYAFTPRTESEVAQFMLRVLDKWYECNEFRFESECYLRNFATFYSEVRQRSLLCNVSIHMAIILVVMGRLLEISGSEIELNPPVFGRKEHFRLGGGYPLSQTYAEMNRIVAKKFSR